MPCSIASIRRYTAGMFAAPYTARVVTPCDTLLLAFVSRSSSTTAPLLALLGDFDSETSDAEPDETVCWSVECQNITELCVYC